MTTPTAMAFYLLMSEFICDGDEKFDGRERYITDFSCA